MMPMRTLLTGIRLLIAGMDAHTIISSLKKIIQRGRIGDYKILTPLSLRPFWRSKAAVAEALRGKDRQFTGTMRPFFIVPGEAQIWSFGARAPSLFPDILSFSGGENIPGNLKVIPHTGHTPGGNLPVTVARAKVLFSGDTVFSRREVSGRTDLAGGN